MALAFVPRAPGRGQFLAIFGGFPRVLTRYEKGPGRVSRPADLGRRLAFRRPWCVPGASRRADPGQWIAIDRSRVNKKTPAQWRGSLGLDVGLS